MDISTVISNLNTGNYQDTYTNYKYSVGIAEQNLSHKQKFIGLTRKSSLSIWSKMIPEYIEDYRKNGTIDFISLECILSQLKKDFINMENNEKISDLGIVLPRAKRVSRVTQSFTFNLAKKYFLPKKETDEEYINIKIKFNKLLSRLSSYYRKLELEDFNKKTEFRQSRDNKHHGLWCSLKKRPVDDRIIHPTPMKVDVAPLDELQPFLDYLKSNEPLQENFFDSDRKNMCMKFTRGALYHDGRLDMCKQVVGPQHIEKLIDSLKCSDKIEHFLLGNNIINTTGAIAIANYIKTKHNIKTWYIAGNEINDEGAKYICEALAEDNICVDLWLKRNPIGSNGAKHIRYLLENNKTITTLDLTNTGLMNEGLCQIMEGLKLNRTLRTLYMDSNGFTQDSSKYIADYFNYLVENNVDGIESLWIDMNRFDDDGIIEIVTAIGKYNKMKLLSIGSNEFTGKACEYIYESFKSHPNLKVLDLGMYKSTSDLGELTNRIGNEGAEYIAKLIKENNVIEYISVIINGIGEGGIVKMVDALKTNETIVQLNTQQYALVLPQNVTLDLKKYLHRNRKNRNIKNIDSYARFLKHTENIVNIDSIYRNNSK